MQPLAVRLLSALQVYEKKTRSAKPDAAARTPFFCPLHAGDCIDFPPQRIDPIEVGRRCSKKQR